MEIMVWLKFLRNVHFVVLQAFIEGLEGWLSLSKMQTDFRSSKSKSSEEFFESVAKVKTIIQLGNRNVNFKYGCKLFA